MVTGMSFGRMLDDSFSYAKEGVWGKWKHWLLLMVSLIIFPLILGYMVRIFRGEKRLPGSNDGGACLLTGSNCLL